jgi:hypothetical protein
LTGRSASGPGMDSTYLQVHTTSCTRAMPFFYPFYHLPTFSVNLRGPDTVCVGQVFHTYVQRDTEVVVGTDCRVSLRLFAPATAQQGLVSFLTGGNEIVRWRATQPGYDTIRAAIAAPKWSYLVSTFQFSASDSHPTGASPSLDVPLWRARITLQPSSIGRIHSSRDTTSRHIISAS